MWEYIESSYFQVKFRMTHCNFDFQMWCLLDNSPRNWILIVFFNVTPIFSIRQELLDSNWIYKRVIALYLLSPVVLIIKRITKIILINVTWWPFPFPKFWKYFPKTNILILPIQIYVRAYTQIFLYKNHIYWNVTQVPTGEDILKQ